MEKPQPMLLSTLIEEIRTTAKRWWKWILGGIIAVIALLIAWRLRRQANEIIRLKAALAKDKERAKDLEVQAKTEKNSELAKVLRDEAAQLQAGIKLREAELTQREKETAEALKRVEAAKSWDDLNVQAKGDDK